jgi:hypothetical protein
LNCTLYKDTEHYANCTACAAGTKTGDICKKLPKPEDLIDFPKINKTKCIDIEWGTGREFTADNNFGKCYRLPAENQNIRIFGT